MNDFFYRQGLAGAAVLLLAATTAAAVEADQWVVDTAQQWNEAHQESEGLEFSDGMATPIDGKAVFRSMLKTFDQKRRAKSLTFQQSPAWDNWTPIENIGPQGTSNAPVFLPIAEGDYWYFAAKRGDRGYHAWRSKEMKTWKHLGQVAKSHWVTTAEYADGKIYLYYDEPNDQDPHLIIGENLDRQFDWGGHIGSGFHPDPTIGFAQGKFYLIVQRAKQDYLSPGPWVDTVEARAGVDEDGDGQIDQWTKWQKVSETYARKPGFARIVETTPAALDLSSLPAGRGFRFEFRTEDATENKSLPILDRVTLTLQ